MSSGLKLFIGIFIIVLLAAFCVFLIYYRGMTNAVFVFCFKRNAEDKWLRTCRDKSDKRSYSMWEQGLKWADNEKNNMKEITAHNDGLLLAAQYFDFGFERAVIIIPGMSETCMHSYYYAKVYKENGYNILLPDMRATGKSEGQYFSIGLYESDDIIEWASLLESEYGIKNILLHGISTGAGAGLLAINDPSCPAFIKGIICDSPYSRFDDFFKNYMQYKKYNTMVHKAVMKRIRRVTGADAANLSPASFIKDVDVPVLFLAGEKDILADPEETGIMFDECGSMAGNKNKDIIMFENGEHGFLRFFNEDKYDAAISGFIKECFDE